MGVSLTLGNPDTLTKSYLSQPEIFADAFNFLLFNGEQRLKPENLREVDPTEIALPYGADGAVFPEQKARDVVKTLLAKSDGTVAYCILGVENQSKKHLAMPVRNGLYDMLNLAGQVQQAAKSHRKAHDKASQEEYLSGFYREDRLLPVVTLVIYWGTDAWDAPLALSEMYAEGIAPEILSHVIDYRINLIAPNLLASEDFSKFQTSLREVLELIKYAGSRTEMDSVITGNARLRSLDRLAAQVLNEFTGLSLDLPNGEESINMCKAWEDQKELGREEGREEMRRTMSKAWEDQKELGRKEGREEMRRTMSEAWEDQKERGRKEGMQKALRVLSRLKEGLAPEEVAVAEGIPLSEVQQVAQVI